MARFALRRVTGLAALLGTVGLSAALIAAQAPPQPAQEAEQETAKAVVRWLERGHLTHPRINDEIARKWARNFLKTLDPAKYYFLKADVDGFLANDAVLDDKIREGDVAFAKQVFDRFLKRADERLAKAQEILKEQPDFTQEESVVDDPERLEWPTTTDEANERLRKRIKLDLLRLKLTKVEPAKALRQLSIRFKDINRTYHQFDTTDLLELYLTSLATVIDPHSNYMGPKTVEDMFNQTLHLSLEGIGASLMMEDGYPVVKEIIAAGAADKDGRLAPEDKIVGIETDNGEREDFVEKKLADVVRKIRGKAGTKVKLVVQPADSKELKIYELTREKIQLTEQRAKAQVVPVKAENGKELRVGVIALPAFYGDPQAMLRGDRDAASATGDCRRLLKEFRNEDVDAVVVDLRSNGGGLLSEAITLSGLFIDQGPVVQVREPGRLRQLEDDEPGTAWDGPMAVLIDRSSASASEIFAGVIKDYGRGLVIGDKSTYGKGTVQQIIPIDEDMPALGAIKLTIQQFFRPNGESTQIRGVPPDIHLPSIRDEMDFGEGKSESALPFVKIAQARHDYYGRVPAELVARLNDRSTKRREENDKFKEQRDQIKKFLDRKARHEISLNEAKFKAEVLADEEDQDEEKDKPKEGEKPKGRHADRPAWESSFYNDEIMNIVADYVSLGGGTVAHNPPRPADR